MALERAILTAGRSNEVMGALGGVRHGGPCLVGASRPDERRPGASGAAYPTHAEDLQRMQEWQSDQPQSFVFPSVRKDTQLSVMSLPMALRRAGGGEFTARGLRSSFRDWPLPED
jgi:hypothetical protein